MDREQASAERGEKVVKPRSQSPLGGGRHPRETRGGEEALYVKGQWIVELADDGKAGARDDLACGWAVEALEVSDLGGVLALAGPLR